MILEFDAGLRLGDFAYDAAFAVDGEILVLFGHSGAGKSVTLQAVAGLLRPERGRIVIGGEPVFDSAAHLDLPPQRRRTGYVVQELALFPHMSVVENVAFGLEGPRVERRRRAAALLERFGLAGFDDRRPASLSGGQKQRVALARALARDVPLLLLDEPFSALDEALRRMLRSELLRLRAELGLGVLFVTHDLREAHLLADRIAVFDDGRVLQVGPRDDVFRRPVSRRVGELTGIANLLAGEVVARGPGGAVEVEVDGRRLRCAPPAFDARVGDRVDVALRAERVAFRRGAAPSTPNLLEVDVVDEHAYGASHTLWLRPVAGGPPLEADLPSRPYDVLGVAERRRWTVELPPEDLHVMRAPGTPGAPGERRA